MDQSRRNLLGFIGWLGTLFWGVLNGVICEKSDSQRITEYAAPLKQPEKKLVVTDIYFNEDGTLLLMDVEEVYVICSSCSDKIVSADELAQLVNDRFNGVERRKAQTKDSIVICEVDNC